MSDYTEVKCSESFITKHLKWFDILHLICDPNIYNQNKYQT